MEKALRRQEEFQRYLLESFPDLILVIDREERYSFVSSRIRDLLGYKPEDLVGQENSESCQTTRRQFVALYREVSCRTEDCSASASMTRTIATAAWRTMRASASPLL